MTAILWIVGISLIVLGLAGIILPALPGTPLVFLGLLTVAWIHGFERVGWMTLSVLGALTALSVILDVAAGGLGAKLGFGHTKQAAWGAVIGTGIGFFFGLPGLIIGPFAGAFAGEFFAMKDLVRAGRAGVGAWIGVAVGIALKVALSFAMIGIFIAAYVL